MKPQFVQHYRSLLQEIYQVKHQGLPYTRELEGCFRVAYTHWRAVRTAVLSQGFNNGAEEIYFFKGVKPLFTSKIAYYTLLYHGQLFQPEACPRALRQFWRRESGRLARFIADHRDFVSYYQSGATHLDERYFRRVAGAGAETDDPDHRLATPGDHLVATLLSLERYDTYVQSLLRRLETRPGWLSLLPVIPGC